MDEIEIGVGSWRGGGCNVLDEGVYHKRRHKVNTPAMLESLVLYCFIPSMLGYIT